MILSIEDAADGIFIINLCNGQNRMNPTFFEEFNKALDYVCSKNANGMITVGSQRFFSNGLDIEYLYECRNEQIANRIFPDYFYPLMKRIMRLPFPTVAVLNGHAYAGGMVLAMAHDFRVMLGGNGIKMCMNEISLGAPIPLGMVEILRCKVHGDSILKEMLLKARPFDALQASRCGLVDAVYENNEELIDGAKRRIREYKVMYGEAFSLIKYAMYKSAILELQSTEDIPVGALFNALL